MTEKIFKNKNSTKIKEEFDMANKIEGFVERNNVELFCLRQLQCLRYCQIEGHKK